MTDLQNCAELGKDEIENLLAELKKAQEKNRELETLVKVKDQQIAELQTIPTYYDVVLNHKEDVTISEIAEDYGKSDVWMDSYLYEKGVQYLHESRWFLCGGYSGRGYVRFESPDGEEQMLWTQSGRLLIYDLLKSDGVLPLIE